MTADKTNAEMYEAYLAARPAYLLVWIDGIPYILQPFLVLPDMAVFSANSGTMAMVVRIINDEVSIEYQELAKREEIPAVPENVSAFYNDKGYQTAAEVESIVEEAMKDMPAGGGGSNAWELINTITLEEDVVAADVKFDAVSEIYVKYTGEINNANNDSSTYTTPMVVTINGTGWNKITTQGIRSSGAYKNNVGCHVETNGTGVARYTVNESGTNSCATYVSNMNGLTITQLKFSLSVADMYFKAGGIFTVYKR